MLREDLAIQVEGLSKQYRIGALEPYRTLRESLVHLWRRKEAAPRIWALKDVSFEIAKGEVVGVIGRNGAGKSTLLKILSRITTPTSGCVKLRGRVGSLLEVGTGFHLELTGRENIFLSGTILGMKRAEIKSRLDEIVAFAEVERFIDTPVKRYSSGMYLRLAFAVAAFLEPEILLVDEVLAVGDAVFQRKCLGRMGEAAKSGRTVLFVSHNMTAVAQLTQRCLLIQDGTVDRFDKTESVVAHYLETCMSAKHGGVVDLRTAIHRKHAAPDVLLTKMVLEDESGRAAEQFHEGTPVALTLHFEIKKPIRQFEVSCTVSTLAGVRLFSILSGRKVWETSPGSYAVRTVLDPNLLRTGVYSISLAVASAIWQDGGYDVASFEIVTNPNRETAPSGDFGVFQLPYSWKEPVARPR